MKTLNKILSKHGIKGLSVQNDRSYSLSANNESRKKFVAFCRRNGYTKVGHQNAFLHDGGIFGYSVVRGQHPECRQFGESYKGLVCEYADGTIKWYDVSSLNVGRVTRVGPDGTKYFNVVGTKI